MFVSPEIGPVDAFGGDVNVVETVIVVIAQFSERDAEGICSCLEEGEGEDFH